MYPVEANLAELSEGVRSAHLKVDGDRVRAAGINGTCTAVRSPVGRADTACHESCKGRGGEPAASARVCEVPEADDVDEDVCARLGKAYLAADPSEGARTMFEGEVEVGLAFDIGLAIDLEFELDVKSICELGRLSPPLGSGGDVFSLLNFIPSPDPTLTLSPVLSNSTTHRHPSASQAPEYSMSKQSTSA